MTKTNLAKHLQQLKLPALSSAILLTCGFVGADAQSPAAHNKITICHRTGSATNPYVMITPDVKGVIEGHLDHEQTGNGLGGDIVPEFTFMGQTYSKNLGTIFGNGNTGARILAAGCRIAKSYPTPSPTQPPPGPTPPPAVPVPEPVTILLFGTGLASIGMAARRRFGKKVTEEDEKNPE